MVGFGPCNDKLSLFLNNFSHFDATLDEYSRFNESGLVAQKLATLLVQVVEVVVGEGFEVFVRVDVDRVPELRLPVMQIVDRVQVHVFFVPTEEGSPDANVEVWLSDPRNEVRLHSIARQEKSKNKMVNCTILSVMTSSLSRVEVTCGS